MNKNIKLFKWLSILILVGSLIPILIISVCVYPQADDFAFSQNTYHVWNNTHSFLYVIIEAAKTSYNYWWEWQGSYFSCFLMSLQPGIYGEKVYHIVPMLLIGLLYFAIYYLDKSVFCKKIEATKDIVLLITNIEFLVIIENIIDQAEAFFWYNSGIHYIGLCSVEIIYYGYVIGSFNEDLSNKKYLLKQFIACLLAFFTAGGNNLTVLAGIIINVSIIGLLFLKELCQNKRMAFTKQLIKWIPSTAVMITCGLLNILSVGNGKRLEYVGGTKHSIIYTIFMSFKNGVYYSISWFDLTVLMYVIFVMIISYYIYEHNLKANYKLKIIIPVIVTIFSYCLISAMFAPEIYTVGQVDTERTMNIIYILFIVFLTAIVYSWTIWLSQRYYSVVKAIVNKIAKLGKRIILIPIAVTIIICLTLIINNPGRFLTTSAMYFMYKGEACECKEVIEYNFNLLNNKDIKNVTLKKLPSSPKILFSDEIDDWKAGTRLYFDKESVNWEE